MEKKEKFPKGSKFDTTMGECIDCERKNIPVHIPHGRGGIKGYCDICIKKHFE